MNALRALAPHRILLSVVAAVGFFGLNGVFLAYALLHPEALMAAFQNPISLVFILEAFVLMGLLTWGIAALKIETPGWRLFVLLSLVGSLAFSVPAFALLHLRKQRQQTPEPSASRA
ncbi:MAG: hypothetical protein AAF170_13065 [Bacteroidota bacterium]